MTDVYSDIYGDIYGALYTPAVSVGVDYQVIVTELDGTRVAILENATPQSCSWALNQAGRATFTLPTLDAKASAIRHIEYEIQIWRDGQKLWVGPIVTPTANSEQITAQCRSLEWYLDSLYFGKADRTNLLTNPGFESGLTGWSTTGATSSVEATLTHTGLQAAKLVSASSKQNNYLSQTLNDYGATAIGSVLVLGGWFFIDSAAWLGEALGRFGMLLRRLHATTGAVLQTGVVEIDGSTTRGEWVYAETLVNMPASATEDIEVRLYSPGGTIYWDTLTLTLMESVSSVQSLTNPTRDAATLMGMIVSHAQDTGYGKNDKLITLNVTTPTRNVERTYYFDQHENIGDALRQYPLEGGPDYWITVDREFTTSYPTRGSHRSEFPIYAYALEGDAAASIEPDFEWTAEGESSANSVVVLGQGDGPDRDEGGAIDNTRFGGNIVEEVVPAPPDTQPRDIDARAAEELAALKDPQVLRVTYATPDPIGVLEVGDTVTVDIDWGYIQLSGTWRIVELSLDCERDRLSAVLNPT